MQPTSKIEFLKAKSKEFAKKYGVNITLNDDSIAKYAEQMTVESMEDDYKYLSEAMKALKHKEYVVKGNTLKKGFSKKYFVRRKTESETTSNPFKDRDETFRQVVDTEIRCGGNKCGRDAHLTFVGEYNWKYSAASRTITCRASIGTICKHQNCPTFKCSGCAPANTESFSLSVSGINLEGDISFAAIGSFYCKVCAYSCLIGVRVDHYADGDKVTFS